MAEPRRVSPHSDESLKSREQDMRRENSAYGRALAGIEHLPTELPSVLGTLEAAKADFEDGLLFNLKALVQAEILGDFLDQARVLFDAGYDVPAASLAGAVLIDMAGGRRNRIANDFLIGAYMQVRPIACSCATAVFIGGISRASATAPFADNIN